MQPGLSSAEAAQRLVEEGPNIVAGKPPVSAARVFVSQFGSLVVWFLVAAAVISAIVGEPLDALAIAAIVVLNAAIGFVQEYRAERAIEALRAMTAPKARVRRNGQQTSIDAGEIVRGDLLVVEAGDVIAADGDVLEAHGLSVNEAALTGESVPVAKRTDADEARERQVFMGCAVATGSALVEVTRTGMKTELGGIARMVTEAEEEETPLRRRVNQLTRTLIIASCAVVAVIAAVSLMRGVPATEIFLAAVSLAVAAVPEGLPAVVTVALALGVRRMAKRDVLVRKLDAVETLGSTTVICTDKTGTLTTGVMTLRDVWGADHASVIASAAACCDAEMSPDGVLGFGDPTEVAIVAAAAKRGILRQDIERDNPRIETHAFDDVRRR
ncbi:MAG TPA: HAD-IC family P-type ATPase, partial [Myxococcota bacterium]|nr:HAD-IC family P-type ATPase [Myxococcota bacterium]